MKDHMLVSCEVAGKKEKCNNFFTRVPTDSGMCCALNWESALKTSEYQQLVKSMQDSKGDKKMLSRAGEKGGLRMVLDLHSNLVLIQPWQLNGFKRISTGQDLTKLSKQVLSLSNHIKICKSLSNLIKICKN